MNTTATPGPAPGNTAGHTTAQAAPQSGAAAAAAAGGAPSSAANIAAEDAAQLQALGYTSKFDRSMSQLENFSLGFTYLSPVVGVYSLFGIALFVAYFLQE